MLRKNKKIQRCRSARSYSSRLKIIKKDKKKATKRGFQNNIKQGKLINPTIYKKRGKIFKTSEDSEITIFKIQTRKKLNGKKK